MSRTLNAREYARQRKAWPTTGQHVLAHFDDETIVVYQAYAPAIGNFAAEHGHFGGDFKYSPMSWIKPNFLWMMYRSDWGRSPGQEVVLAVRLSRTFFDSILEQAVPSSFDGRLFQSQNEWKASLNSSEVRLQWDPDHLPTGEPTERRAIQIGLRGAILEAYGQREPLEIIDMSDFVAQQRAHIQNWQDGSLLSPVERVYVPSAAATRRSGIDSTGTVQAGGHE